MIDPVTNIVDSASESRALLCCTAPDTKIQTKIGEHLAGKSGATLYRKYCYHCGCAGTWYLRADNAEYWWPLTVERHLATDMALIAA